MQGGFSWDWSENFDLIRQLHPFFWKNNIYFGIYIACLFVLFLARKREKWRDAYRSVFWYSVVVMIGICYNPIFTRLIFHSKLMWFDMSTYARVFLILPVFFTVAYVVSGFIDALPRIAGDIVFAGVAVLIVLTGITPRDHEMYMEVDNPYKINIEAVQICDQIEEDLPEGERCWVYIPPKLDEIYGTDLVTWGIRQYDSNIMLSKTFPVTLNEIESESGDLDDYLRGVEAEHEEQIYFVCLNQPEMLEQMEENGYQSIGTTNTFSIMKKNI